MYAYLQYIYFHVRITNMCAFLCVCVRAGAVDTARRGAQSPSPVPSPGLDPGPGVPRTAPSPDPGPGLAPGKARGVGWGGVGSNESGVWVLYCYESRQVCWKGALRQVV